MNSIIKHFISLASLTIFLIFAVGSTDNSNKTGSKSKLPTDRFKNITRYERLSMNTFLECDIHIFFKPNGMWNPDFGAAAGPKRSYTIIDGYTIKLADEGYVRFGYNGCEIYLDIYGTTCCVDR